MELEHQIKQKSFANETEKALVNISYTSSYLSGVFHSAFKEYSISIQQFNVLRIVKGCHPDAICINEITHRMVDKMSNASRLVDKLLVKNYLNRSVCDHDKRQVDINITKAGHSILDLLNDIVTQITENHNNLTPDEFVTLNRLLDKVRNE